MIVREKSYALIASFFYVQAIPSKQTLAGTTQKYAKPHNCLGVLLGLGNPRPGSIYLCCNK
jgi:hypothetical protein